MPSVLPSRRHSFNTGDARTASLIKSAINKQFVPEEELVPNFKGPARRLLPSILATRPQLLRCYM